VVAAPSRWGFMSWHVIVLPLQLPGMTARGLSDLSGRTAPDRRPCSGARSYRCDVTAV
jgi:hypothetical protein